MAHWIAPGTVRAWYLWPFYALGIRPHLPGGNAWATAVSQDRFLRENTFYRFMNEVVSIATYHFERCETETGSLIRAKRDLLLTSSSASRRVTGQMVRLAEGKLLDHLTTYYFNAAFVMSGPKKADCRDRRFE